MTCNVRGDSCRLGCGVNRKPPASTRRLSIFRSFITAVNQINRASKESDSQIYGCVGSEIIMSKQLKWISISF